MSAIEVIGPVLAQVGGFDTNSIVGFMPIILMFVILYFLMIRPQMKRQKEHKALVAGLAKGDEIILGSGMLGKVNRVTDLYIEVEVSSLADKPVEVLVQRASVQMVLPKGTIKGI